MTKTCGSLCSNEVKKITSDRRVENVMGKKASTHKKIKFGEFKKKYYYNYWMQISQPTKNDFKLLVKYFSNNRHGITKIEVTADFIYDNAVEADCVLNELKPKLSKKYSRSSDAFFSTYGETLYLGSEINKKPKRFYMRIYVRDPSKVDRKKRPCFHMEFVIYWHEKIKKEAGFNEVGDLKNADIEKIFKKTIEKYITYTEIDFFKIHLSSIGLGRRKKLTQTEKNYSSIGGQILRGICEIKGNGNLLDGLKKHIKEGKLKPGVKRYVKHKDILKELHIA